MIKKVIFGSVCLAHYSYFYRETTIRLGDFTLEIELGIGFWARIWTRIGSGLRLDCLQGV